uniref:Uncharacterized protein n=1 Tax=Panagrolaimus superbus TaxID=310955 RepID=A0A914ZCX5_9BILA
MDQPKTFIAYAEISENDVKQDGIKKQKHIYNTVLKLFQQQSKTLTLISQKINTLKALVKKALHLLEGKTFKYDVATIASTDYGLIHRNVVCNMPSFTTSEAFERSLCSSNLHEIIPLKKTIICYQDFYDIVLVHFDVGRYGIHQEFSILESGSAISLSIDKYFMASVEIENVILL